MNQKDNTLTLVIWSVILGGAIGTLGLGFLGYQMGMRTPPGELVADITVEEMAVLLPLLFAFRFGCIGFSAGVLGGLILLVVGLSVSDLLRKWASRKNLPPG